MKNNLKLTVKITTFFVVFLFFIFGIYAQNKLSNALAYNNISKTKQLLIKSYKKDVAYAFIDARKVEEQANELEEWMFDIKLKETKKRRHFEEWMYDEYFWQIKIPEWDQEPEEEPYDLEEWMFHLELKPAGCVDLFSGFKEQKWMRKQDFIIL